MGTPDTIEVSVSEPHISLGRPDSELYCPMALAARDIFGDTVEAIWVVYHHIVVGSFTGPVTPYALPQQAREWLLEFDNHNSLGPIDFVAAKDDSKNLIW